MLPMPLWVKSGHRGRLKECPLYPQKRTSELSRVMSALCQKRTLATLFDQLVGAAEQRCRHIDAESLCGLEVDHQFVLGWRLYGEIGRLLAFEDAIDVSRGAAVLVDKINAIGDQCATGNKNSIGSD